MINQYKFCCGIWKLCTPPHTVCLIFSYDSLNIWKVVLFTLPRDRHTSYRGFVVRGRNWKLLKNFNKFPISSSSYSIENQRDSVPWYLKHRFIYLTTPYEISPYRFTCFLDSVHLPDFQQQQTVFFYPQLKRLGKSCLTGSKRKSSAQILRTRTGLQANNRTRDPSYTKECYLVYCCRGSSR